MVELFDSIPLVSYFGGHLECRVARSGIAMASGNGSITGRMDLFNAQSGAIQDLVQTRGTQ